MTTTTGVSALTSFHNVNCSRGIIYFDVEGVLKIASLSEPNLVSFDSEMPVRKVPVGKSIHHLTRHSGTTSYVLVVSEPSEVCHWYQYSGYLCLCSFLCVSAM
jgi:cleavage and polyadenylation specificity factor subunit 1